MGIQGGAQFRAANTPVEGTAVPSRLNNFAVDAHYGFELSSIGLSKTTMSPFRLREGLAGRGVVCHLPAMIHAAFSSISDSSAMGESLARDRATAHGRSSQAVAPPSTASVVAVM